MSDSVKKDSPIFRLLTTSTKERRKRIIDLLTRDEINNLCEIILNGIAGEPKDRLHPDCVAHCRRYKRVLRQLAYKSDLCWKSRKELLKSQSGKGWFTPLIETVLDSL